MHVQMICRLVDNYIAYNYILYVIIASYIAFYTVYEHLKAVAIYTLSSY